MQIYFSSSLKIIIATWSYGREPQHIESSGFKYFDPLEISESISKRRCVVFANADNIRKVTLKPNNL